VRKLGLKVALSAKAAEGRIDTVASSTRRTRVPSALNLKP